MSHSHVTEGVKYSWKLKLGKSISWKVFNSNSISMFLFLILIEKFEIFSDSKLSNFSIFPTTIFNYMQAEKGIHV